ncbi:ABC transporter substrate-binding protein [Paenibacillus pinihumi]|uniref:ABC transporter substrate-binding protein n=1 Tax=Paenibacillus pinihumi TaxID=669462 RepID=UPI00056ADEBF|nr:ABC transporter substrate-binding protein [Paenibacillus pinihumi]
MLHARNRIHWFIMLIVLTVVLSGCGSSAVSPNSSPQAGTNGGDTAQQPNAAQEAATTTYKDGLGREVEIPTHPQRIVVLQYLPEMLAVGVKPVGAATHLLKNFVSIKDQVGGIEDTGAANDPNLEKILELQPDLIIGADWHEEQLDKLSKIAPTVIVKWAGNDAFQHFKDTADVLGMSEQAEEWVQNYNKKAEEARAKLSSFVKEGETFGTVVIGGFDKGQLRVYGNGNVGYVLFESLKFPMTDAVKQAWNKDEHELGMNISMEKLPEFASADRLFVVKFDNDPDFLEKVGNSRLWSNLPAVKNHKVYTLDSNLWFSYDVMSFSAQIDDAVKLLSQP